MKRPRLPVPGIILGATPERADFQNLPGAQPLALLCQALPLVSRWQTHRLAAATRRILAQRDSLRQDSAVFSQPYLLSLRAKMSRKGFSCRAGETCTAMVLLTIERTLGYTLRANQVMAAQAILQGTLAEVPTGEGKTLATALAACVAALAGIPVHIITSNDYLACRDAAQMQPLAACLGITIGAIDPVMDTDQRRRTYAKNIVYTSARELIFDYLRDGLSTQTVPGTPTRSGARILRGLCMAIIDEADSVLIDEAAVPFILSELDVDPVLGTVCNLAMELAQRMRPGFDFRIDNRTRSVRFTADGLTLLAKPALNGPAIWAIPRYREEMVELALFAVYLLKLNEDYLIQDGKVTIIDSNSGRLATGRSWSRGLHQLVEIKERSAPTPATRVLAQITFQRFFPRYLLLGGTSGTLIEARRELFETYALRVQRIPTGRPSGLRLASPMVATTAAARWKRVIAEITVQHAMGRPILVGTDSVNESERLSRLLTLAKIPHRVLNARHDKEEAGLIAAAGRPGAVTVTTNMAGRGTDIVLDKAAIAAGGLHVISCQHNSSQRIDRQLFGRAGRRGLPGSALSILSLEEGLLGRSLPQRLKRCLPLFANRRGFLPAPLGRLLVLITQRKAESEGRTTRQRLRETDAHHKRLPLFGARTG